jgi:hypothetical protein
MGSELPVGAYVTANHAELADHGVEVCGVDGRHRDGRAGYGRCGQESAGLDSVRDDRELGRVEAPDPLDADGVVGGKADARPAGIEEVGQVSDLGLLGYEMRRR